MAEASPGQMTGRQWAMLLLLSLVWGGAFFFNGVAVQSLPVLTVVAARVALAALVLMVVMRVTGSPMPRSLRVWQALAVMALLNNVVPFCLIVWGQAQIASGLAAILNATTPLFTVLLAHLLTHDERLTPARGAGVALGLCGVAAMVGPDALDGLKGPVAAQLACLGAAVSYAVAGIHGRRFRALGVSPLATATGQVILSTVLLVPLALVVDRPAALPPPTVIGALVALAVVSTAFAYLIYFRLLETAGATNATLVTFLIPVSAILLGVGLLGETLAPRHLAGMGLIGVGLAAIDGRLLRWLRSSRRACVGRSR